MGFSIIPDTPPFDEPGRFAQLMGTSSRPPTACKPCVLTRWQPRNADSLGDHRHGHRRASTGIEPSHEQLAIRARDIDARSDLRQSFLYFDKWSSRCSFESALEGFLKGHAGTARLSPTTLAPGLIYTP